MGEFNDRKDGKVIGRIVTKRILEIKMNYNVERVMPFYAI